MIDLHTHVLPFLDDGAEDMEMAVEMLRMAKENSTKIVIATPHCNIRHVFDSSAEIIRKVFSELKTELKKHEVDITIAGGMEIFGTEDIAEKLAEGKLLTLNNTKYALVEFDFYEDEEYIFFVVQKLIDRGYVPVVAHPERYECFAEKPDELFNLYKTGAVIQVNKGSVLGSFGEKVQYVSDIILSHRLASVAASDAHSCEYRTPVLSYFAEYLDENYGEGCSSLLLRENPGRILSGKDILRENPIPIEF